MLNWRWAVHSVFELGAGIGNYELVRKQVEQINRIFQGLTNEYEAVSNDYHCC